MGAFSFIIVPLWGGIMNNDLIFQEKVRVFMKFMNNELKFKTADLVRFCDLDPSIASSSKVYSWFYRQMYKNLDLLQIECQRYRNIYPIAYERIKSKIEKSQNSLSREKKIELLMEYIEHHDIPTGRSNIRFCDIDKEVKDATVVGIFIQTKLEYMESVFFEECTKYKDIYPIAFQKIKNKIEKRHTLNVQKERLRIYMEYMNQLHPWHYRDKIRFCDIDKSCVDTVQVESWVRLQLRSNLDWFKEECIKYREIYYDAYCKINSRIVALENKSKISSLSFTKRVEVIMNYLEDHDIMQIDKNLTFQDISFESNDLALVRTWLLAQFRIHMEVFIEECGKYKELYPDGYRKLLLRKDDFVRESNRVSNYLSFEKRVELFMCYIEYEMEFSDKRDLKFSDLGLEIKDEANVKNWLTKNMYVDLQKFIEEYSRYKETYPNAYQKVSMKVNNSRARTIKSRLLLLEQLKQIRNCLVEEGSPKVKTYKK